LKVTDSKLPPGTTVCSKEPLTTTEPSWLFEDFAELEDSTELLLFAELLDATEEQEEAMELLDAMLEEDFSELEDATELLLLAELLEEAGFTGSIESPLQRTSSI
jgi:hypothetical protein